MAKKRTEPDEEVVDTIVFNTLDLLQCLDIAEQELASMDSPRVEVDREAILSMIRLSRRAIRDLSQTAPPQVH